MASEIAKFTEIVMPIYIIRLVSGAREVIVFAVLAGSVLQGSTVYSSNQT